MTKENKEKEIGLFDFINMINSSKTNKPPLTKEEFQAVEGKYVPFIVNRHFSHFGDTLFIANELNKYPNLPYDMQFDLYCRLVKPKKRYTKWAKERVDKLVTALSNLMYISEREAMQYTNLLTDEEKEDIIKLDSIREGGRL